MKRFYFHGYYRTGTWLLNVDIVSTDAFNATLTLCEQGWHDLKLLASHDLSK